MLYFFPFFCMRGDSTLWKSNLFVWWAPQIGEITFGDACREQN